MTETKNAAVDTLARLGITVDSKFVPFSQSTNPVQSLNWIITVRQNGRDILATRYSAGIGHCPSYALAGPLTVWKKERIDYECEFGRVARGEHLLTGGAKILPDACDVISSLLSDSNAIDHPTFESWASDLGFDTDSRKAESIYRECLAISLKLRAGLGESVLSELRDAFLDY